MNTTYHAEIEFKTDTTDDGYDYLYVDMNIDWRYENYDYDDAFGTVHRGGGYEIDIITWDKSLYSEEQNKLINEWLDKNYSWLEETESENCYN